MTRPGLVALSFIALLIGGAFAGLFVEAARDWSGAVGAFDGGMLRIASFTLWQAALSTLLSVAPAILVARALSRHPDFPGRGLLLRLFAVPLGLPAIVAALGLLALYGRAGFVADLASAVGAGRWPGIYGLSGILIAHVFFNLPLATRLMLAALETVPPDQWRLASQLGMRSGAVFRLIEWPALRGAIPGVAALVFMLCVTSFTLVLTLGGGPAATTLEVAIYQSLRFDFEPARAVALTVVQVALTVAAVLVLSRLGADATGDANLPIAGRRMSSAGIAASILDGALIGLAALFVLAPMAAIVAAGLQADLGRLATEAAVLSAMGQSLALSLGSAALSVALSLSLVVTRRRLEAARQDGRRSFLETLAGTGSSLVLVVPPIVIGAGWFVLLRNTGAVFAVAPLMVLAVNAVMAMPFATRAIRPAHDAAALRNDRLCAQLGISGLARARLIDWPELRRPLFTGFAFAMALSLGDLGVIALFGSDGVQTLPYLLYARMGSYRTEDAAGLALLLGLLCLVLMSLADRLGKDAR
ncbi:thiamine/thiamine pyrophosphate ABC transporter permease [Mesorhizobium australicum]|uniref:Thiamine transport system permease protein ThiP n=1 Tax=Mesorhizobium australicum TaxID=536018 RepID=A0A1X7PZW9_9HYPH|nr:thiamine/thiamine pyrophosphate ABC transporter permease [Mesorhizobium australicum]SMH57395.1 thiamine transport system permease protein [Mesorhizobium australicum]